MQLFDFLSWDTNKTIKGKMSWMWEWFSFSLVTVVSSDLSFSLRDQEIEEYSGCAWWLSQLSFWSPLLVNAFADKQRREPHRPKKKKSSPPINKYQCTLNWSLFMMKKVTHYILRKSLCSGH